MKWLRLLVRVLLLATLLAALAVVIALGPLRDRTAAIARPRVEQALAAALHTPVSIGALRVSVATLRVEADAVAIGPAGALARAAHVSARLLPRTSLRQARPVAEASADEVFVDVPGWVDLLKPSAASGFHPTPPFRLRAARVGTATVRLSEDAEPLQIDAGSVSGVLEANVLGRLRFIADAQQVALAHRGARLALERAHGRGGETATGWRLDAVEVVGDGVQLASTAPTADRLPIRGRVSLPRLAFASEVFERLGGDVDVDAALVGPLQHPAAEGTIDAAGLTVDGTAIGDVRATLAWQARQLSVSAARLIGFGGETTASGDIGLTAPFAYRAELHWSSLDVRQLAHLDVHAIKPFAAGGQGTVAGTIEPLAVQGDGSGTFAPASGTAVDWHGHATYGPDGGEGEVEVAQTQANTVHARLAVTARRALSGSLELSVADPTALGALLPIDSSPNVRGVLSASAQLDGTIDDPRASGQLAGRDVALLGVTVTRMGGSFTLDRTAFRTDGVTAALWQGSLALRGTVALDALHDNDWQLQVTDVPGDAVVAVAQNLTGTLLPIGRGILAVQLSGRGPWPQAQLTGSASMGQFWLTREWIQRAALQGTASWPHWRVDGEMRNATGQTLVLQASGTATEDVAVTAHADAWELTAVQSGELTQMGGVLTLDASLGGPLRALNGRAALQAHALVVSGHALGTAEIDAAAARGRWQLTATALGGSLTVRGSLAPDAGWPFSLDGRWTGADFGHLLAPASEAHVESEGTVQASGRLTAIDQFDATVRVASLHITSGPYELAVARPAQLECRRGACTLDGLDLRGPETELRASGTRSASGAVRLALDGQGDLRLLELAGHPIESARGKFTVDIDVRRGDGRWQVEGALRFDDMGLDVGAPMAVTRASGRFTLTGSTVRIEQFGGRMGSGTFQVTGTIDLAHGPDLTWQLTDVGANLLPSLEVELSGQGTLVGTWQRMQLAGRIDIERLLYDRDIGITDFLPTLNRALAEAPHPESAQRIALDLHIVAPGELFVENNVARIEARADLRVTGPPDRPRLDGRIEALDGTVTFRDRVFELQGATVDFRPDLGLVAALNISAETTIDTPDATYVVDVRVTGTTAEPRAVLSSDDPSLTQNDLATLLALGMTTAQMRSTSGNMSFGIQQNTRQLLPIDRVSFESTYSRTTGTFEPTIKLGKDLTDSLAMTVGQAFGVSSRTTAEATYRLTPRIFVPVSWESQTSTQEGAFAAGVKVRYEFWRVTPFTLLGGFR